MEYVPSLGNECSFVSGSCRGCSQLFETSLICKAGLSIGAGFVVLISVGVCRQGGRVVVGFWGESYYFAGKCVLIDRTIKICV